MGTWHDYLNETGTPPEWPYPIKFGEETEMEADVLVLGGGIAGCWAAITAARHVDEVSGLILCYPAFVVHDDIHTVFVKVAVVSEREEVELQALTLHHTFVRHIGDADFGKVRLARDGAERGEFRAVETHPVVVAGVLVLEGFQHFRCIGLAIDALASQSLQF